MYHSDSFGQALLHLDCLQGAALADMTNDSMCAVFSSREEITPQTTAQVSTGKEPPKGKDKFPLDLKDRYNVST